MYIKRWLHVVFSSRIGWKYFYNFHRESELDSGSPSFYPTQTDNIVGERSYLTCSPTSSFSLYSSVQPSQAHQISNTQNYKTISIIQSYQLRIHHILGVTCYDSYSWPLWRLLVYWGKLIFEPFQRTRLVLKTFKITPGQKVLKCLIKLYNYICN